MGTARAHDTFRASEWQGTPGVHAAKDRVWVRDPEVKPVERRTAGAHGYIDKAEARIYCNLVPPVYSNVTVVNLNFPYTW